VSASVSVAVVCSKCQKFHVQSVKRDLQSVKKDLCGMFKVSKETSVVCSKCQKRLRNCEKKAIKRKPSKESHQIRLVLTYLRASRRNVVLLLSKETLKDTRKYMTMYHILRACTRSAEEPTSCTSECLKTVKSAFF